MEWSNELVLEFLELYQMEAAIWNPWDPNHKNKMHVAQGWERIRSNFSVDLSVTILKKKKESLMATYRFLHHKVHKSAPNKAYKPSWFCYAHMNSFLHSIYQPRHSIDVKDSAEIEIRPEIDESRLDSDNSPPEFKPNGNMLDEDNEMEHSDSPINTDAENSSSEQSSPKKNWNKNYPSKKRPKGESLIRMDEACSILETVAQKQQKDECDIYGELVATKLRKFDAKTRDIVMNDIDNSLFQATMRRIHNNSN